jgi:hypothetical protein
VGFIEPDVLIELPRQDGLEIMTGALGLRQALGFAANAAAAITPADLVLEPSAGTGLLAIFAELAGAGLVLNELADTRADLLGHLFPAVPLTRHDAAHIHDHLAIGVENCWSAWLSSERRVGDGNRAAIFPSMTSNAAGEAARARMTEPNLRRNRTCAVSQAS